MGKIIEGLKIIFGWIIGVVVGYILVCFGIGMGVGAREMVDEGTTEDDIDKNGPFKFLCWLSLLIARESKEANG